MEPRRGYWQTSDGSPVAAQEAWDIWAVHAYGVLVDVAKTYHQVTTYKDVGTKVQQLSGISTSALLHNWIGAVLSRVLHEAHRRGDPPLTALVVHTDDGKVGVGYQEVLKVAGESVVVDELEREQHAARSRLTCYRHFGAVLPDGGGRPALAPRLQAAVDRRHPRVERSQPFCPNCNVQLPARGVCDSCG